MNIIFVIINSGWCNAVIMCIRSSINAGIMFAILKTAIQEETWWVMGKSNRLFDNKKKCLKLISSVLFLIKRVW